MNHEIQGYYAYSRHHRIQMVSPCQPLPKADVTYLDQVLIAVHEFIHLVNNEINADMPMWLNEGVAVHSGTHGICELVCQHYANSYERFNTASQ